MNRTKPLQIFFGLSLMATTVTNCAKKDKKDPEAGPGSTQSGAVFTGPSTTGTLQLNLQFHATANGASATALNLAAQSATFKNKNIASGAPDIFNLRIKRIDLIAEGATTPFAPSDTVPIYIAKDEAGDLLPVRSGSVDISHLFTEISCLDAENNIIEVGEGESCECGLDENGKLIAKEVLMSQEAGTPILDEETGEEILGCPAINEGDTPPTGVIAIDQSGPFSGMQVTFAAETDVQGCVSGDFSDSYSITGEHTYCTKSGYELSKIEGDASTWAATDFEAPTLTNAETSLVDLDHGHGGDVQQIYSIDEPITLSADNPPQLSLLVDLNRVLRFTNGATETAGGACQAPNPDMPCGPYFFTLSPSDFMFAFLGKPGRIEGYYWQLANNEIEGGTSADQVPANKTCSGDNCIAVAGWMTTIYRPDASKPFFATFMPDDDNALTVLKGSNYAIIENNTAPAPIDPTAVTANNDHSSAFDITYNLGSDFVGTLYNFSPITTIGTTSSDSYFIQINDEGIRYGTVNLTRGL